MEYDGIDRRQHKRYDLACPVVLLRGKSDVLARTKTVNISDGGALVPMYESAMPETGTKLHVRFSVPRSTSNSYMLEGFSSEATVIRQDPRDEESPPCVGLKFEPPLSLAIEV
ncbi:MAG: PilZ domain-containing protein [Phycisphaerae bacterium]